MNSYGRNRRSIADLEQELYDVFSNHPQATLNDENQPVISGDALVDILRTFSRNHDSELMTKEEEEQLKTLLDSNPGLAVTPQVLLQFIAMRTTISPRHTPEGSPPEDHFALSEGHPPDESDDDYYHNHNRSASRSHSRSSSRDSNSTSRYGPHSRPPSRGPPVPPKTPTSAESPFDVSSRQRSTPLETSAPSSWSRRPAPPRRTSDAGRGSDSESGTPIAFNRSHGRSRAPSNPSSPGSDYGGVSSPTSSTYSRPHSRSQSQSSFVTFSPDRDQQMSSHATPTGLMSPPPSDNSFDDDGIDFTTMRINSLPMPRGDSDSDSDDDFETSLGLVMDRSAASSTVSLDMQERLDAMQKTNSELGRKLMEAENTLQRRLGDHEVELEDMELRLEETKAELNAAKREEKELRTKEKVNISQIAALESEVAKLVKNLENAKNSYTSLQKQYQEQCHESERYRLQLRDRDEEMKTMREAADNAHLESLRWDTLRQNFEAQMNALHDDLDIAAQTTAALDEQKQENMLLKETIDRMRFEMDEMRTNASATGQASGGTASVKGSVSKSLGAELLSRMKQLGDEGWGEDESEHDQTADMDEVSELLDEENDTESEDVIQTIITRTKRKVASRAKRIETVQFEEVKEYSDAEIQHDPVTSSCSIQTDPEPQPRRSSFSIQTDTPLTTSFSSQTEPEPVPEPIVRVSIEIQTNEPEPEPETSTSASSSHATLESDDETLASSSSTLLPPTPKAQAEHLHDLPPAYQSVANEDRDQLAQRVANETLKTWHKGMTFPVRPVVGGISEDAVEDWKALKEELGIECTAIERLVEESARTGLPRPTSKDGRPRNRRGRFYNVYNTYVYGNGDKEGGAGAFSILSTGQFLFCVGASAAVAFLVGHAMAPQYAVPGGATYYDRAAWSSFNTMQVAGEGFPGDGVSGGAFLGFLGRLGGEAARTLRGWPT